MAHELLKEYHDHEWGSPIFNDQKLFEYLTLEGAQAGLSWLTVLKKREYYKRAYHDFSIDRVAAFTEEEQEELLTNRDLIQHKLKLNSVIHNANCIIKIQMEHGSFSNFIWSFVDHKTIVNQWASSKEVPSKNAISEKMSKSLKAHGFKFVGPTICYSFMQATGLVHDHTTDCFKFENFSGDKNKEP
ncbi:DNA-3-methyladenine glycosylase I [Alkalihalobacillus deserti]|uniref:DNA-3-methyladenine glycosylase I n=1 Tax=Alkalihalobacillus deserti TaxID=2879466 RepID=UPI0027DFC068|nr:DNA-3-methyladenine glycosylase I [Alkalihalobacillus deserti]